MTTTVVNVRKDRYDVYIGRPSVWGNPFRLGFDGGLDEVVEKYKKWIAQHPEIITKAKLELKDKVLGCYCKPGACHGDVLAGLIDAPDTIPMWYPPESYSYKEK